MKDRRPQIAITADDAARLQQAEAQLLGSAASGFQVPVGQQQAAAAAAATGIGGAGGQHGGCGLFGWPPTAFGAAGAGAAAAPAAGLSFGFGGFRPQHQQQAFPTFAAAAPAAGEAPFVFSAGQPHPAQAPQHWQQQQQQQQQADMME